MQPGLRHRNAIIRLSRNPEGPFILVHYERLRSVDFCFRGVLDSVDEAAGMIEPHLPSPASRMDNTVVRDVRTILFATSGRLGGDRRSSLADHDIEICGRSVNCRVPQLVTLDAS